jgi:hypothetical protein
MRTIAHATHIPTRRTAHSSAAVITVGQKRGSADPFDRSVRSENVRSISNAADTETGSPIAIAIEIGFGADQQPPSHSDRSTAFPHRSQRSYGFFFSTAAAVELLAAGAAEPLGANNCPCGAAAEGVGETPVHCAPAAGPGPAPGAVEGGDGDGCGGGAAAAAAAPGPAAAAAAAVAGFFCFERESTDFL